MFPLKLEYIVRDAPINLDWQRIAKRMKGSKSPNIHVQISSILEKLNISACFSVRTYALEKLETESIIIENGIKLFGLELPQILANCEFVSIYTATIGTLPRMDDDIFENFVVDSIGSEAAEQTARQMQVMLQNEARCFTSTKRRSPGYGGFDISQQALMLKLSGGEILGVKTNPKHYLIPEKSTTGLLGWKNEKQI